MTINQLLFNKDVTLYLLTLMRAGELCSNGVGWMPGCVWARGGTEVMLWARTSGVERGYGGPKWGAWEVGVGGTRGG